MDLNDQLKAPLELVIEVTDLCNLSCLYCYGTEDNVGSETNTIPFSKIKEIIDEADELNIFEICISGGECFLRKDIFHIFDYLIDKQLNFSIVSNGSLLREKEIQLLNERNLINNLQISIDSHIPQIHNAVRGKFDETLNAINLINSLCHDKPILGSVIHKQNYLSFFDTLMFFSNKCTNFHLMNVQASIKAIANKNQLLVDPVSLATFWKNMRETVNELPVKVDIYENDLKALETARFTGCTAGKTKLVIKPNLDVIPCDITRDIILGNLKDQSISEIWDSDKRKEIGNSQIEPCYARNLQWYCNKSDLELNMDETKWKDKKAELLSEFIY